jgi:hypothetical protein
MQQPRPPAEPARAPADAWYRQSIVWLGATILAASLAGCIWMIVLGANYDDAPLDNAPTHTLLNMPVHGAKSARQATGTAQPAHNPPAAATPGQTP